MKSVKLNYQNKLKRVHDITNYDQLLSNIFISFQLLPERVRQLSISYNDNEGDQVQIANEYDFKQAYIYMQKASLEVLKLSLEDGEQKPQSSLDYLIVSRDEITKGKDGDKEKEVNGSVVDFRDSDDDLVIQEEKKDGLETAINNEEPYNEVLATIKEKVEKKIKSAMKKCTKAITKKVMKVVKKTLRNSIAKVSVAEPTGTIQASRIITPSVSQTNPIPKVSFISALNNIQPKNSLTVSRYQESDKESPGLMVSSTYVNYDVCRYCKGEFNYAVPEKHYEICPGQQTTNIEYDNLPAYVTKETNEFEGLPDQVEESKIKCPSCDRQFRTLAYEKHSKVCDSVFGNKRKAFNAKKQRFHGNLDMPFKTETVNQESNDTNTRIQCKGCRRTFNAPAYVTHNRVCQRVFHSKRTPFNSKSKRIIDSEHAAFIRKQEEDEKSYGKVVSAKVSKWKRNTNEFRAILRQNRELNRQEMCSQEFERKQKDSNSQPNRIRCNGCSRTFSAPAIEIHSSICERQAKRDPFDLRKMRLINYEHELLTKKKEEDEKKYGKVVSVKVSKWKIQSEFMRAMVMEKRRLIKFEEEAYRLSKGYIKKK
jgi:hypothetical protein